jgi:hypothetical protein
MPRMPVHEGAPSIQQRIKAHLTDDLISLLEEMVPHRCPSPGDSPEHIWSYSGQRSIVDVLKAIHGND